MNFLKTEKIPHILEKTGVCPGCGSGNFYHLEHGCFCSSCSLVIISEG